MWFLDRDREPVLDPKFGRFTNRKPVFGDQKMFQKSSVFWIFLILGSKIWQFTNRKPVFAIQNIGSSGHPATLICPDLGGRGRPRPLSFTRFWVGVAGHAHSHLLGFEWAWPATPILICPDLSGRGRLPGFGWAWPATPTLICPDLGGRGRPRPLSFARIWVGVADHGYS